MVDATWSRCGAGECLRVRGIAPGSELTVWPTSALEVAGAFASMAGQVVVEGDDLCFVPRFAFVEGTAYSVVVDREPVAELVRPRPSRPATTEVTAILPGCDEVPRNLLRLYVEFSAPMSEGQASTHLALVDEEGGEMDHALLVVEDELWDGARRRLTVLLDPARIKRGLVPHRELGYPLRQGETFRVDIGEGFLDATGAPLRRGASFRYVVGPDERRRVDPDAWTLHSPRVGTLEPLTVGFDRPLDVALLRRCLSVTAAGHDLPGSGRVGPDDREWSFRPAQPWEDSAHGLRVDERLEDLAGNSVARVFDRHLSDVDPPITLTPSAGEVIVAFRPRAARAE